MITICKNRFAQSLVGISASILLAPAAMAYVQKLHSEEVQEAFSLGQSTDPDTVKQFFEKYSRMLDCSISEICVNSIELRTPFEEVAVRSRERGTNYTEQDAEADYGARPTKLSVHIFVLYPIDYSGMDTDVSVSNDEAESADESSFYGFRIRVSQDRVLKPVRVHSRLIDLSASPSLYGSEEEVILDFDPAQFGADPLHVQVVTPSGKTLKAEFDLSRLK